MAKKKATLRVKRSSTTSDDIYLRTSADMVVLDENIGSLFTTSNTVQEVLASLLDAPSSVPKDLSLITSNLSPINMSQSAQEGAKLYVDNNGTPSKVAINDLDYTKVVTSNDESSAFSGVRNNDYVFLEDNGGN